jgi:hypothetical protein
VLQIAAPQAFELRSGINLAPAPGLEPTTSAYGSQIPKFVPTLETNQPTTGQTDHAKINFRFPLNYLLVEGLADNPDREFLGFKNPIGVKLSGLLEAIFEAEQEMFRQRHSVGALVWAVMIVALLDPSSKQFAGILSLRQEDAKRSES